MPVNPVTWLQNHATIAVTVALALVLLTWAYEAVDEAEDYWEATGGFKDRAKSGTGGAANVVLVSLVMLVGWAATTFQTAGEAIAFMLSIAPEAPVLVASVFTISLGAIGLSDLIVLRTWHFVGISAVAVLLGLAYRTDFGGVSS